MAMNHSSWWKCRVKWQQEMTGIKAIIFDLLHSVKYIHTKGLTSLAIECRNSSCTELLCSPQTNFRTLGTLLIDHQASWHLPKQSPLNAVTLKPGSAFETTTELFTIFTGLQEHMCMAVSYPFPTSWPMHDRTADGSSGWLGHFTVKTEAS